MHSHSKADSNMNNLPAITPESKQGWYSFLHKVKALFVSMYKLVKYLFDFRVKYRDDMEISDVIYPSLPKDVLEKENDFCERAYTAELSRVSSVESKINFQSTMTILLVGSLLYFIRTVLSQNLSNFGKIYALVVIIITTILSVLGCFYLIMSYNRFIEGWKYAYLLTMYEMRKFYTELIDYHKKKDLSDEMAASESTKALQRQIWDIMSEACHLNLYTNRQRIDLLAKASTCWILGFICIIFGSPLLISVELSKKKDVDWVSGQVVRLNREVIELKYLLEKKSMADKNTPPSKSPSDSKSFAHSEKADTQQTTPTSPKPTQTGSSPTSSTTNTQGGGSPKMRLHMFTEMAEDMKSTLTDANTKDGEIKKSDK